jgi:cullin-associated NEDD8-dissociated protein 1
LDVLGDFFSRFPAIIGSDTELQKRSLKILLGALENNRAAVRKRAMLALSALGSSSTSEVFTTLAEFIAGALSAKGSNIELIKIVVQLLGALAKVCPRRLGRRLPEFMPRLLAIITSEKAEEEDELREACLQSMESIILRCPTEVTPFVTQIVEVAITLLKYDPNYAGGGESDEEMVDGDDFEDDDDLVDEQGYSEDDDISWKVRRGSAKLLATIISTRSELLLSLITSISPALVLRFSEREESVRLEVMQTFMALLRQVQLYGGTAQATEVMRQSPGALKRKWNEEDAMQAAIANEGSPVSQIKVLEPAIAKTLAKELVSKSMATRFSSYAVLRELMVVLRGGLDEHIGLLLGQTDQSLKGVDSNSGPSANLKAEVLSFLQILFRFHSPTLFESHLDQLVPFIITVINDKLHRDTIEGLNVSTELVKVLRPIDQAASTNMGGRYKKYIIELYKATTSRVARSDSDQEIKEKAIATLGALLSHAGDDLANEHKECLPLILERLNNEVTRLAAVKVIAQIAASPVCKGKQMDAFTESAIGEVAVLLRKNSRPVRVASFDCLAALIRRSISTLSEASATLVVKEIEPLLAQESNLNLASLALLNIILIIDAKRAVSSIEKSILPVVYTLVCSPLLQGLALESILSFFSHLLSLDPANASKVLASLTATIQPNSVQVLHYSTVAQCIGAVVKAAPDTSAEVIAAAQKVFSKKAEGADVYFHLLIIGEIGRTLDLSKDQSLYNRVLSFYEAKSEEIRSAAAFATGNMAVGNLGVFLPIIQGQIKDIDPKKRLLSLQALKELITHGSPEQLTHIAEQIWVPLFEICATKDEAIQNIGAECLARLTLTQPAQYLPQLQSRIQDPVASTRASVIAAIRFTLTETGASYDDLLAPMIVDFLSLVKDDSLEVRKHAMFAFNAAAHNRPSLIRGHLNTLLPMLYLETVPRPELLRKVVMGPFTITTDDGLDLRNNAFETMYTLLDTCFGKINLSEYIERVIAGLGDEDGIKVLSSLMLIRLASVAPVQVAQRLDEVVEPITSTLKVKLKDQATKQDVEKSTELQRSLFRAMVALDKTPHTAPKFAALIRDAKASSPLYREVEAAYSSSSNGLDRAAGAMELD